MNTDEAIEYEDLTEAVRLGRPVLRACSYGVRFAQGDLNFRPLRIADPVPLGQQILEAAGITNKDEFSLFVILPSGDFEDVRLDEPFDLRAKGAERFVAFLTDRVFKITVNGEQVSWGKPAISGVALYTLEKPNDGEAVFLEVRGGEDRLVEPNDLIDLTAPGIERFFKAPKPSPKIEIFVNSRPRIVTDPDVSFEQIVQFAFPGPQPENVIYSMSYRGAASVPHAGALAAGGHVTVKNRTKFNVTSTVKS